MRKLFCLSDIETSENALNSTNSIVKQRSCMLEQRTLKKSLGLLFFAYNIRVFSPLPALLAPGDQRRVKPLCGHKHLIFFFCNLHFEKNIKSMKEKLV